MGKGRMLYAIGDIHGELGHLERPIKRIETDAGRHGIDRPRLVFGDRGSNSKGIYNYLGSPCFVAGFDAVFLRGNHEQMLLAAEHAPSSAILWLTNGGAELVESYGFTFRRAPATVMPEFFASFPEDHRVIVARTRL